MTDEEKNNIIRWVTEKWQKAENVTNQELISNRQTTGRDGLYVWQVPTSIFIGVRPVSDFSSQYTYNATKSRHEFECSVPNPTENRTQTEPFKSDKYVGIVFRGNNKYGWASQGYPLKAKYDGHFAIHCPAGQTVTSTDLPRLFQSVCEQLKTSMNTMMADLTCPPHIDDEHKTDVVSNGYQLLQQAFEHVMETEQAVEGQKTLYEVVALTYGGGDLRVCSNLGYYSAEHRDVTHVPEMWGNQRLDIRTNTDDLVGFQRLGEDDLKYVRLAMGDVATNTAFYPKLPCSSGFGCCGI